MAHENEAGIITKLNLLCEGGNFSEWYDRMTGLLEYNEYGRFLDEPAEYDWTPTEAADADTIIRSQLCHSIQQRFWPLARYYPCREGEEEKLVVHLRTISRPFRFFDLPDEVRNRVYHKALPEYFCRFQWSTDKYPALLHTTSQLRREALPIFFGDTTFGLEINRRSSHRKTIDQVAQHFKHWTHDIASDHVRYLRKVEIGLWSLSFNRAGDLVLSFNSEMQYLIHDRAQEEKKQKHVEEVNRACKFLGIQDQSIVLALTNSNILWED